MARGRKKNVRWRFGTHLTDCPILVRFSYCKVFRKSDFSEEPNVQIVQQQFSITLFKAATESNVMKVYTIKLQWLL